MSSILQFIVLQILPRTSMVTGSSLPICARALVLIPAFNRSSVRFIPFSISIIHIFLYDQAILHGVLFSYYLNRRPLLCPTAKHTISFLRIRWTIPK